ncbi:MAG: EAL domain-containing protein [Ruminococcaceae bacterium]|nr:EAL domain-containing protein [Oscillospiraceae bacterium]
MYSTNYEIAALVLSVLCLVYSLTANRRQYIPPKGLKNKLLDQHFVFILMVLANIFSAIVSVGGVYLETLGRAELGDWKYLLHASYFVFHSTLSVSFCIYVMNVNGTSMGRSKRFYRLFLTPYLLTELLVLTNGFTHLAFYMDENIVYHRGVLMPVLYASGGFYVALGFYFFFRYKRAVSRADSITIGVVMGLATLGTVIQAVWSHLLLELFCEALASLALMVLLEERSGHLDVVTGALNRAAFADANRRLIANRQSYSLVVVSLTDLETFSALFSGREVEELLMDVASWLTKLSSERDLYCFRRTSFAIVCGEGAPRGADELADEVLRRFEGEWTVRGMAFRLCAGVCVIRVPEDAPNGAVLQELLTSEALNVGGTRRVSVAELSAQLRDHRVEALLRRAVEEHRLRVWYQPIWSSEAQRTVAAEALLRVEDDELRKISPEEYIPIAEKTGLIREIGLFVFEEVCRFLRFERDRLQGLEYIELNLSIYQFMYGDLVSRFEEIRRHFGVSVDKLNLEITESASTRETPAITEALERLRALGYTLSLDDFGTGYSNLMQLISSSYKNVKIDKSLLWDAEHNPTTAELLESLIRVIRSLGCNVVQEGVETEAQLGYATDSGSNLIQGYYFSRPVPQETFLGYLKTEAEQSQLPLP